MIGRTTLHTYRRKLGRLDIAVVVNIKRLSVLHRLVPRGQYVVDARDQPWEIGAQRLLPESLVPYKVRAEGTYRLH